jgi:flagellar hook-length control protein FliK
MDALLRLTTVELPTPASGYSDASSRGAGSASGFDGYLQQAQSQDSTSETFDRSNGNSSTPSDLSSAANATTPKTWSDANSSPKPTDLRQNARQLNNMHDVTTPQPANASDRPSDKVQTSGNDNNSSATSPSGQDGEKRSSGNRASTEDASQTSANTQHDENKSKHSDTAAVVLDINTNSLAAAAASAAQTAAASNAAATNVAATAVAQQASAAAKAAEANGSASAAKASSAGTANPAQSSPVNTSQAAGMKPAQKQKYAAAIQPLPATAESTNGNASGQAATLGSAAAAASVVAPASAASVATTAAATSGTTSQTSAAVSALPNTTSTSLVQSPAPAAASSVEQDAALAAPNVAAADALGDAQVARDLRAKSAIDALSSTGPDNNINSGPSPAGSSNSTVPAATSTTSNNASTTANGTTAAHSAETSLSQADRVRFVQRVEQAFQDANSQGGSVRLRLSPPDLGSLKIEIKVSRGEMTARVEADTPSARNLILDNLPVLRDRLAQHDIKVQRFDVDLMDRSGGGLANQSPQQQTPSWQNSASAAPRAQTQPAPTAATATEVTPGRVANGEGRLNVVV